MNGMVAGAQSVIGVNGRQEGLTSLHLMITFSQIPCLSHSLIQDPPPLTRGLAEKESVHRPTEV